jgi:hypothetical protein
MRRRRKKKKVGKRKKRKMEWLLPEKGLWYLEKLVVFIPTFPLPLCEYVFLLLSSG